MIYITTFFDILFKFWWIFPVLAFLVYGFYFLKTSKQEKKRNKLRKIENPNVEVLSEEEKYKEDFFIYFGKIEQLVGTKYA